MIDLFDYGSAEAFVVCRLPPAKSWRQFKEKNSLINAATPRRLFRIVSSLIGVLRSLCEAITFRIPIDLIFVLTPHLLPPLFDLDRRAPLLRHERPFEASTGSFEISTSSSGVFGATSTSTVGSGIDGICPTEHDVSAAKH